MEFLSYIKTEWAVISQAPLTFVVGCFIVGSLAYGLARLQFADRISSLNARISLKNDRIRQFEENKGSETPDEAHQTIKKLQSQISELETKLKDPDELARAFAKLPSLGKRVGG